MPVLLKGDRSVLFVHVPKTGGSTVETLFVASGWKMHLRETRKQRPHLFPLRRCSPQHYHAALLGELFDVSRFDLVVTLGRDPVSRFRSEFAMRHTKLGRGDEARVEAWANKTFALYDQDPYVLDNHLRPQSEFLVPGSEIYRLEDGLDSMVADLNARFDLGLATEIPHRLSSSQRGLSSSAVEVSESLRDRLQEFYAADYEAFGYSG